ncbi:hypothetical protein QJA14_25635, partial [Escherichia coli]
MVQILSNSFFSLQLYIHLDYSKNNHYFLNNPSEYIIAMRKNCWKEFEPFEKEFTTRMLSYLIDEERI